MAYADLVSTVEQITLRTQVINKIPFPTKSSTGSNVDISAWDTLTLTWTLFAAPTNGFVNIFDATGKVASSAGVSTLTMSVADLATALATLPLGSYNYTFSGKPTSGDDPQMIASGTMTMALGQ